MELLISTTNVETTRYKHLTGCYELAKELLENVKMDNEVKEKILNSVLLHDIGYSNKLNKTDCHSLDSYNYLKDNYPDVSFYKSILLHGELINYCPEEFKEEIQEVYDSLTDLEFATLIIIDYCDNHVNGYGVRVTVDERWEDIKSRHDKDSPVVKYAEELTNYCYHIDNIIDEILRRLPNLK